MRKKVAGKTVWGVLRDTPEKCMNEIMPLMNLFVDLHNRYVPATNAAEAGK